MTIQLIILVLALAAIIFFFKNFNACVYFIVMADVFFRIVTYLKVNVLRADAFSFLGVIPESVPDIIKSFDLGAANEILIALYVMVYIVFEILLVSLFVNKRF